jgi:ABC-2 type transport system ATP-binding protein
LAELTKAGVTVVLSVRHLTKDYGDGVGVHDVDLDVEAGELIVVAGHNGAGKSTLLAMLAGLVEPTEGTVRIAGYHPGSLEARAATSYVPDLPSLYDDLSVTEHLRYVALLHGTHDWQHRAHELLEQFDLVERADDVPTRFSRGMRQKTSLALGFVRPFDLLLLDEPFVGLDERSHNNLRSLILHARASGAAVIVATHDLDIVSDAGRVVVIHDGAVIHDNTMSTAKLRRLLAG